MIDKVDNNVDHEDVVDSQKGNEMNTGIPLTDKGLEIETGESEDITLDDVDTSFETGEQDEGFAEPQDKQNQTSEENAQFKKMRLRAEQEAKGKLEKERRELEKLRMEVEQKQSEKKIIDEYLNPSKVYQLADDEGISEDHARKLLEYEANQIIAQEKEQVQQKFNELQSVKSELKKDKYFGLLEGEVDEIMSLNPDADYEAIYYYQRGKKAEELEQKLASNVEQRTVANMHDRAKRRNVGGSTPTSTNTGMSDFGVSFASFMGVDPREAGKINKERRKGRNR